VLGRAGLCHAQADPSAAGAPVAPRGTARAPAELATALPDARVDAAFGAYQRGMYLTAFKEATQRIAADPNDAAAMTLLGELHGVGLGVTQDWVRAADWYRRAALRGDPQASFSLAMLLLNGKEGVKADPVQARLLLESAMQAVPAAAYHLGLVLLGERRPDSDRRAAELFRRASDAAEPDAQYALAVLYREGRGVQRSAADAALWMGRSAQGRNVSAQVEYAVMLFNGDGVRKDETAGARMFLRAAERGNPIAQNRIARIYAAGRGLPRDLVEAAKWHMLAARQGLPDPWLDDAVKGLTPAERSRAEEAVRRWIGA
jgi:TPR repeat protein